MAKLPKGMSISYSMVTNDKGNQELTFKYNDTSGINIDKHYEGQDAMKMVDTMYRDVVEDMTKQAKEIAEEKAAKQESLKEKTDSKTPSKYMKVLNHLQDQVKALRAENDSLKIDNQILNERITQSIKKQEERDAAADLEKILNNLINSEW